MDPSLLKAFKDSAEKVLRTMAFLEVDAGEPYIRGDDEGAGDVSAIVGITGPMAGSLSLSFSERCLLFVVSSMFGEEMADLDDEVTDAAGELVNIISGDARRDLAEGGLTLDGAVPMVITGAGHRVRHMSNAPVHVIPFQTAGGRFRVEVCLAEGA